ncbi:SOS response-associated peptidase [Neptunicella sp. SCSIO 80796]|uniref:SOS response-associated peptidase n=1 Tax=Neptunicella plasticusilytica TaxID=3117012 RepID=UPI003A4E347C
MCGRLNVIDDPLVKWVGLVLGIDFGVTTNPDLRPTQDVSAVINTSAGYQQLDTTWGIKPGWSKSLLINAKAETVATKRTFANAFHKHRCLIPVNGWYEWRDEGGARKQKYLFSAFDDSPMLMAGIYYPNETGSQLVTLTTRANTNCAEIHNRQPVIIPADDIDYWFGARTEDLNPLLEPLSAEKIKFVLS